MKDKSIRQLWKLYLITGWKHDASMWMTVAQFVGEVAPILGKLKSNERSHLYLTKHLDMRVPARSEFNIPVKAFIANHSPTLNNYLWDHDYDVSDMVVNIDKFKWVEARTVDKRYKNMKKREQNKTGSMFVIKQRELDKKHHWNIVK